MKKQGGTKAQNNMILIPEHEETGSERTLSQEISSDL